MMTILLTSLHDDNFCLGHNMEVMNDFNNSGLSPISHRYQCEMYSKSFQELIIDI